MDGENVIYMTKALLAFFTSYLLIETYVGDEKTDKTSKIKIGKLILHPNCAMFV